MKRYPLTPVICRIKRFVRGSKPELRVRAEGEVGLYAEKGSAKPALALKFDQDLAMPLLKAAAVVLALIAVVNLLDD